MLVLLIIDGWGIASPSNSNAFSVASTPYFDYLGQTFPCGLLTAHGEAVGFEEGRSGKAASNYLTLGTGKVVWQGKALVSQAIRNQKLKDNPLLKKNFKKLKQKKATLHLIGSISQTEEHAKLFHLEGLVDTATEAGVKNIALHLIIDDSLENLADIIKRLETKSQIATISGSFFAEDASRHFDRSERFYQAVANGRAERYFTNFKKALRTFEKEKINWPQVQPTLLKGGATIAPNDIVLFFNSDHKSLQQLVQIFVKNQQSKINNLKSNLLTLTDYGIENIDVLFPSERPETCLSKILSEAGIKHLKVFDPIRFPVLTHFFNGKKDGAFKKEEWAKQEDGPAIFKKIISEVSAGNFPVIIASVSELSEITKKGNPKEISKKIRYLDSALRELAEVILRFNGTLILTSAFGQAEELVDLKTGLSNISSSCNPVPLILISKEFEGKHLWGDPGASPQNQDWTVLPHIGALADVAPTILKLLGLEKPIGMVGKALVAINIL